jgi:hypothetical protein
MSVRLPWGKYKGTPISDVPSSYLCWITEEAENIRPALRQAAHEELAHRFGRSPSPPPPPPPLDRHRCPDVSVAADLVAAGLRSLAKRHHPDSGGDTKTMQLVNATADWLKAAVRR